MHYHCEVWLPDKNDWKKQIERVLAPFDEQLDVEFDVLHRSGEFEADAKAIRDRANSEELKAKYTSLIEDGAFTQVFESWEGGYLNKETGDWGYMDNPRSFWDWWQIGGRWKGAHLEGYNPDKDPDHKERCSICDGTGFRNDLLGRSMREKNPTYTCNGCGKHDPEADTWSHGPLGAGYRVAWPTQWEPHNSDIIPLADASTNLSCYTLVIAPDPSNPIWICPYCKSVTASTLCPGCQSPRQFNGKGTTVFHEREWNGEDFVDTGFSGKDIRKFLEELGIVGGYLVTVDYHC